MSIYLQLWYIYSILIFTMSRYLKHPFIAVINHLHIHLHTAAFPYLDIIHLYMVSIYSILRNHIPAISIAQSCIVGGGKKQSNGK
jgi:hypothetical protein